MHTLFKTQTVRKIEIQNRSRLTLYVTTQFQHIIYIRTDSSLKYVPFPTVARILLCHRDINRHSSLDFFKKPISCVDSDFLVNIQKCSVKSEAESVFTVGRGAGPMQYRNVSNNIIRILIE